MTTIRIEGDGLVVDAERILTREHICLQHVETFSDDHAPFEMCFYGSDENGHWHKGYVHATVLNPGRNESHLPTDQEIKWGIAGAIAGSLVGFLLMGGLWLWDYWRAHHG